MAETSWRNNIIEAIAASLAGVSGLSAAQIKRRPIQPTELVDAVMVGIVQRHDRGDRIDGNTSRRTMTLIIGVTARFDVVDDVALVDPAVKQVNRVYDLVHAKLETDLVLGCLGHTIGKAHESPDGLDVDVDYTKHFGVAWAACEWTIEYDRALGASI